MKTILYYSILNEMFRRGRVFRLNYTCRVRVPFAGNVTGRYWLWRWCVAGVCTRWRSCCVSCTGNRCGIVASLISANVRSVTASRANRKPPLAAPAPPALPTALPHITEKGTYVAIHFRYPRSIGQRSRRVVHHCSRQFPNADVHAGWNTCHRQRLNG